MFAFVKKFFGSEPKVAEIDQPVPYKVETPSPKVDPLPAGTEAVVVTPNAVVPNAVVSAPITDKKTPKPRAPAKPKAEPKPKAPAKPRAKKTPAK